MRLAGQEAGVNLSIWPSAVEFRTHVKKLMTTGAANPFTAGKLLRTDTLFTET